MTLASWICFVFCCAANRSAASLDQSDTFSLLCRAMIRFRSGQPGGISGLALSSDFPRLVIHVALPPIGSAFFGTKAAIDSGRSSGLEVQTIILLIEGEPPNFFFVGVLKCSYDFGHEAPDFHGSLHDRLTGAGQRTRAIGAKSHSQLVR